MRTRLLVATLVTASFAVAGGCAPSLSTMKPARLTPPGHVAVSASFDATNTSGSIRNVIDALSGMGSETGLTRSELRQAATAGSAALVQPPSIGTQVALDYGLSRRFEIGVRTSVNTVRAGGRWQFLRQRPGIYGNVGFGVSGYLYGLPIQNYADDVALSGYTRWDVDVPVQIGYSTRSFHVWGGPKLLWSSYDGEATACVAQRRGNCVQQADLSLSGSALYLMGHAGVAFGDRRFWIAFELTIGHVAASGDIGIVAGTRREALAFDEDGLIVAPSIGLLLWL